MKRIATLLILCITAGLLFSQNVKKIDNLKDGWGLTFSYTGEVKDGKPNGMGVAKYSSGSVLRYVGSFVNGMYSGKGTMFFNNDAFLTGEWKNGKLNGKGANLTESGSLYIGDFADGVKNGKGILFYKDNSVIMGGFLNDKLNGRSIQVWTDGSIISDAEYRDDKRNGMGYQYEAKAKKLYEGEWRDDKWVQSGTPAFNSFLKASSFTGEVTSDHILIGPTNSNRFLTDSSYYYDLGKNKRYFGRYENGHLRNGFIIRDDSSRFYGPLNDDGAAGYCYDFKFKKYYSEGTYVNDFLSGQILDLDLVKKSAYYGGAVKGAFTGKAYFFNDKGTMYAGDYVNGRLTGNGYRMETNGRSVSGTWEDGSIVKLNSVITKDGKVISGNPKSFTEAVNTIIMEYPDLFDDIIGTSVFDDEILDDMREIDEDENLDFSSGLIKIPGSTQENLIADDFDENTFYYAKFLQTDNGAKAKAKYNELATQLQAVPVANSYLTGKQKLTGKITPPNLSEDKTETEFSVSGGDDDFEDFHIWLRLRKKSDGDYVVEILFGAKSDDY